MANYTISKRQKRGQTVYIARVREKELGIVTFSRAKTFHTKTAATAWAKNLVNKVELNLDETDPDLIDCTLSELITRYMQLKESSNRPLGRTAKFAYAQILRYPIARMLVTKIRAKDIVTFCIERKQSEFKPSPQTISIDVSCIRKVLRVAKSTLGVKTDERAVIDAYPALHDLKLISRSDRRERRVEEFEHQELLEMLKKHSRHNHSFIPLLDLCELSLATCCRIGELCRLRWAS